MAFTQIADAKEPPLRLAPSSKWRLDYAEDSCKLMRYYGTGRDQVTFVLERFGDTEKFWLWLAGRPVYFPSEKVLQLKFGPDGPEQKARFYKARADGLPSIVFTTPLSLAQTPRSISFFEKFDPEREKAVTELAVSQSGRTIVLEMGSMAEPFKALRTCTDDLLSTWGFDLAKRQSIVRSPVPKISPGKWLRPSDYPGAQLLLGRRAMVHFRLEVDNTGIPTKCNIQGMIGQEDFKTVACRTLMQRAQFHPALDQTGRAVPWFYQNSIIFHLD